jgi:molecular chaperone DnaJ
MRGGGRGDLHVRVNVVTPTRLSERERELLRELAAVRTGEPQDAGKSIFQRIRDKWERRA